MAGFGESYRKIITDFRKSSRDFFDGLSDMPMCTIYSIFGNEKKAESRLQSILKHQNENKGPDGLPQIGDYEMGDILAIPFSLGLLPVAYCAKTYRNLKNSSVY